MNYHETDPELMEILEHFAGETVINEPGCELQPETRYLAVLATLLGCQSTEIFRSVLPRALAAGLTPITVKELVYQAVDYLGIGRALPFLEVVNEVFSAQKIALPLSRWLAENCFGDYYTRGGLDLKERELITFCFLMAQGGCEPQLTAHAKGNMHLGNDKDFLIRVVSQCLPYIGYPRSLNAITCVNKAAE